MAQILIIEDNAANMRLAELLLTSAGHAVLSAVDAESGLKLARERQPDLILMDIHLPEMDGLTATSLLKKDAGTAAIPVIALTAMAMKEEGEDPPGGLQRLCHQAVALQGVVPGHRHTAGKKSASTAHYLSIRYDPERRDHPDYR